MNIRNTLAATAALLVVAGGASAATITPVSVTADCAGGTTGLSTAFQTGTCGSTTGTFGDRTDLNNIEYSDDVAGLTGDTKFFSLGKGGALVVQFAKAFSGLASVIEITQGTSTIESADVYGSKNGTDFFKIGTATNSAAVNGSLSRKSIITGFADTYTYLGFVDTSSASGDGFDVSAIAVSFVEDGTSPSPVPLPAAGLLLIGGLGALGAMRKRRRAA